MVVFKFPGEVYGEVRAIIGKCHINPGLNPRPSMDTLAQHLINVGLAYGTVRQVKHAIYLLGVDGEAWYPVNLAQRKLGLGVTKFRQIFNAFYSGGKSGGVFMSFEPSKSIVDNIVLIF